VDFAPKGGAMRILVLALMISFIGNTSAAKLTEEELEVERIVTIEGHKKDAIYDASQRWMAETFRSGDYVLEYEDKEAGKLVVKGRTEYPCKGMSCLTKDSWDLIFTMRIDSKDNKFRMTFTQLKIWYSADQYRAAEERALWKEKQLQQVTPVLLEFSEELRAFIVSEQEDEDW
jgi:hypothetical protein